MTEYVNNVVILDAKELVSHRPIIKILTKIMKICMIKVKHLSKIIMDSLI